MAKKNRPINAPPVPAADAGEFQEFPKAMYRPNKKNPDGYDVKRVESAEEEAALGKGWSPTPPESD